MVTDVWRCRRPGQVRLCDCHASHRGGERQEGCVWTHNFFARSNTATHCRPAYAGMPAEKPSRPTASRLFYKHGQGYALLASDRTDSLR